jgi:hypothetical protein
MSFEKKERRVCDICGKVLNEENFYSCTSAYARKTDVYYPVSQYDLYVGDKIPTYNNTHTDVCLQCWEKML